MSNNNFWNNDTVSEYDLIQEEVNAEESTSQQYDIIDTPQIDEQALQEISEESAFELDEYESNVVYKARLRLEMARLYEMLINHNLFEGVEASEQAIQKVQNELKQYIVERLEVLLGIKEEPKQTPLQPIQSNSNGNFNEVEVDFLKQLAYKGTLGKSMISKSPLAQKAPQVINPVTSKIGSPTPSFKDKNLKPIVKKVEKNDSVLIKQKRPYRKKEMINQQPKRKITSNSIAPRNLTQQEIEELAKDDLKNMISRKPFHKMTAKEKAAEIAKVNAKHPRKPATENRIPMPDINALQMKYLTEQSNRLNNPNNQMANFNSMLANKLISEKINKE